MSERSPSPSCSVPDGPCFPLQKKRAGEATLLSPGLDLVDRKKRREKGTKSVASPLRSSIPSLVSPLSMSEVAATFSDSVRKAGDWIRKNPAQAFLLAAIAATFVYFYGFLRLYAGLPISTWAWLRYLPAYNQEHSKLVPVAFLFLVWYHRQALVAARKEGSNWGLLLIGLGVLLYVVAARALQARLAIAALPFLFSGVLLFVWGREVARILLFPSLFLLFLVPLGAIEQMTFRLQFLITGAVQWLSSIFGIKIYAGKQER